MPAANRSTPISPSPHAINSTASCGWISPLPLPSGSRVRPWARYVSEPGGTSRQGLSPICKASPLPTRPITSNAWSAQEGVGDLVDVETGVCDPGATIGTVPDLWERRDVRAEMTYAVQGLIEHLNEHVE